MEDTIAIYYSPEDPNNAETENPASGLHRETWLLLLGGVLLGTFGALTIQFRAVPQGRSWFSVSPRMVMIIVTLGVTIETINLLLSRTPNPREWIAIGLSLTGTAILDRHALHLDPKISVAKFVRSWSAAVGIPLLLAGILIALT